MHPVGANNHSPLQKHKTFISPSKTIGSIIRGFKIGVVKCIRINKISDTQNFFNQKIWQNNYYEHIIRNQHSYDMITNYIVKNPEKWKEDKFF